jgi:hypothetical protein
MTELKNPYKNLELLQSPEPDGSTTIQLRDAVSGAIAASIRTIAAERSDFAPLAGIRNQDLSYSLFAGQIRVDGPDAEGMRTLLFYLALRHTRMSGRRFLIASLDANAFELKVAAFEAIPNAPTTFITEIQRSAYKAFEALSEEAKAWAAEHLLTQELEATVKARCADFYGNAFFKSIFDGTITKNQYIESVANNHQFVRWTTRLLGRIVGITEDRVLRRSYIEHLGGEIDHELLLENDLRHLGADVEWVKTVMVPNVDIHQFMCVQESMNAFHQDPMLFLAVPFSIEGITAHMSQEFMEQLKRCIASWGIERPSAACTFLASHIEYDGGDDGHWEASRRMFQRFLRREQDLQRVLNVVHMVMNAVGRAYESYVAVPDLTAKSGV